jgi:hypothetical protein
MAERITIDRFTVSGFRAYLKEQTFRLHENGKPKSLAVFAPNAKGKSSLVDALEFFFSEEGTLKRLGQRRSGTQAGLEALGHVRAHDSGQKSVVSATFRDGQTTFEGSREVTSPPAPRPQAADRLLHARKLDFIIRGHELRHFVEEQTPQERYKDVSQWFGLTSLVQMQRHLRSLRLRIKDNLEKDPATKERLKDLSRLTGGKLTAWEEQEVLVWLNANYLHPLEPNLSLPALSKGDSAYALVEVRKTEEERRIGLDAFKNAMRAIKPVYAKEAEQDDGKLKAAELRRCRVYIEGCVVAGEEGA